jgi:sulfur carrier protein
MAQVTVNGAARDLHDGLNVREILAQLDIVPRLVVVELNGVVVYPERWNETIVNDGDRIEIVSFVGGG